MKEHVYSNCDFPTAHLLQRPITKGFHVEEVTVYRNLHGRSEAETCKLDNGRGEAEFIIVGIRSPLRHGTRLYPVIKLT